MQCQTFQDLAIPDVHHPSSTTLFTPSCTQCLPVLSCPGPLLAQMPPPAGSLPGGSAGSVVALVPMVPILVNIYEYLFTCLICSAGGAVWGWTWVWNPASLSSNQVMMGNSCGLPHPRFYLKVGKRYVLRVARESAVTGLCAWHGWALAGVSLLYIEVAQGRHTAPRLHGT